MTDEAAIEQYQEARRAQLCLQVLEHQLSHPRCKLRDACKAVDIPERTFRHWLSIGVLDDWLSEFADSMVRTGRNQVLENWPKVLKYMAEIATGVTVVKGANPVSAAEFLRKVAGIKFSVTERPPAIGEMNVFMLPQAQFTVKDGKPVLPDIIEGELVSEESDQAPSLLESSD